MISDKRRNIIVGHKTWDRLRDLAKKEERSMSDLIREAILKLFEDRRRKNLGYDPVTDRYVEKDQQSIP